MKRCVVDGSPWTRKNGSPNPNGAAWLAGEATDEAISIWTAGADIGFIFLPEVLVIPDPVPPPEGPGILGDLEQDFGGLNNPSVEVDAAVTSCRSRWAEYWAALAASETPPRDPTTLDPGGITVVFAGELRAHGGGPQQLAGFTPTSKIYGTTSAMPSVCERPYHIDPQFLSNGDQWTVIETRDSMSTHAMTQPSALVGLNLAHELGHVLLLRHGDGMDNDGDGRFDGDCDTDEIDDPNSLAANLMAPFPAGKDLTSFQRDLARAAALLIPGAFSGD